MFGKIARKLKLRLNEAAKRIAVAETELSAAMAELTVADRAGRADRTRGVLAVTAGLPPRTDAPERVRINGLQLPLALTLAIDERRWRSPAESLLRRVFREKPVRVRLFDLAAMREENRAWIEIRDRAFFGHLDENQPPGDIDPTRSLLLGTLGPHLPFALDYRVSQDDPRVLYLHSGGDRWITVACNIEMLLARLKLNEPGLPRASASTASPVEGALPK